MTEKLTRKIVDERVMQIIQQSAQPLQIQRKQQAPDIAQMIMEKAQANRNGVNANNNETV